MEIQNITSPQKLSFVKKSDLTEKKILFQPTASEGKLIIKKINLSEVNQILDNRQNLKLIKAQPKIVDPNFVN